MTTDSILLALFEDLEPWFKTRGAILSIAQGQLQALEMLVNSPAAMYAILVYGGDEQLGDQEQNPLADCVLELIVGMNLGLEAKTGAARIKNKQDRPALTRYMNDARARFLTAKFPDGETSQFLMHLGTPPVVVDNMPLDAYRIRAKLGATIELETDYREIGQKT